jgi:C-terminal processing protease CtpA/Prc
VRISVARGQEPLREVEIVRNDVHRPAVKWVQFLEEPAGFAYLWLSDFHPDSDRAVLAAIDELAKGPTKLNGLVLDLRFNGGGYLDACVSIANLFLREGVITTVKKRGNETESEYRAVPEKCRFPELPLVILVNQDSASASEVLTGALQDHGRALVVGELTYGKGMVNTLFSYKKLDFKLKVTTGHYATPKGRNLEGHFDRAFRGDKKGGIIPDREVALDGELLRRAYAALNDHEPPPEFRAAVTELCRAHDLRAPGILPVAEDPQLQTALAALRERTGAEPKDRLEKSRAQTDK